MQRNDLLAKRPAPYVTCLYFLTAILGLNIDVEEISYGTERRCTANEVLNDITRNFVHGLNISQRPFDVEEFGTFVHYLERLRGVLVDGAHVGSLIITVRCSSLQNLDELWEDYRTGHLNEMAQKYLVTEEILKEFGLIELKLMTTIVEEEYRACRQYFLQWPGWYDSLRECILLQQKKINVICLIF